MREIKFRAWDKTTSSLSQPFDFSHTSFDFRKYSCSTLDAHSEKFILMQSTGLQDKNDKEIFEGDVVRCPVEAPFQTTHGEWVDHQVLYRNGVWIVSYLRSASGDVLPRGYTAGDTTTYRELDGKDVVFSDNDAYKKLTIEVIGNIYENPELFSPSTTSIQS